MSKELDAMTTEELLAVIQDQAKQLESKKKWLYWNDQQEEAQKQLEDCFPVLARQIDKDVIHGGNNHLLIEGENLHALMDLHATHKGKIGIIYIDPPYNTGNKDFTYNDSYVDKEDGFKKSKWLSFMRNRLVIAKGLMTDDGVIFISIDDRMLYELKLLMDQIFGETNFVANFVWKKKRKGSHLSNAVCNIHEYVLCYKRQGDIKLSLPEDINADTAYYPLYNASNPQGQLSFPGNWLEIKLPDGTYKAGEYGKQQLHNDIIVINGIITNDFTISGHYRYSQDTVNGFFNNKRRIIVSKDLNMRLVVEDERVKNIKSILTKEAYNIGTNEDGDAELREIFGEKKFDFPKPVSLLEKLIQSYGDPDATVLDFFAGSGTTGHAVLNLNQNEGMNLQFIMVTNNENGICEDITHPRIKKVMDQQQDGNLRYFQVGLVPKGNCLDESKLIIAENTEPIAQIDSNMFGIVEQNERFSIYQSDTNEFAAVLKQEIYWEELKAFIEEKGLSNIKVYVCSFSDDNYSDCFGNENCANLTEKVLGSFKRSGIKDIRVNTPSAEEN